MSADVFILLIIDGKFKTYEEILELKEVINCPPQVKKIDHLVILYFSLNLKKEEGRVL